MAKQKINTWPVPMCEYLFYSPPILLQEIRKTKLILKRSNKKQSVFDGSYTARKIHGLPRCTMAVRRLRFASDARGTSLLDARKPEVFESARRPRKTEGSFRLRGVKSIRSARGSFPSEPCRQPASPACSSLFSHLPLFSLHPCPPKKSKKHGPNFNVETILKGAREKQL